MKPVACRQADRRAAGPAARIVFATLFGAACLMPAVQAQDTDDGRAVSPVVQPVPGTAGASEIERLFWDCDYVATTRSMALTDAMGCSMATELFQRMAFGGDFDALLAWWRERKAVEHAKRDAESARRERASGPVTSL